MSHRYKELICIEYFPENQAFSFSKAKATFKSVVSSKCFPMICIPIGSPSELPAFILIAGCPVTLKGAVLEIILTAPWTYSGGERAKGKDYQDDKDKGLKAVTHLITLSQSMQGLLILMQIH